MPCSVLLKHARDNFMQMVGGGIKRVGSVLLEKGNVRHFKLSTIYFLFKKPCFNIIIDVKRSLAFLILLKNIYNSRVPFSMHLLL